MPESSSLMNLEEAVPPDSPSTAVQQRYQQRRSSFLLKCLVGASILCNIVLVIMLILKWSNKDKPDVSNRGTKDQGLLCFTCNVLGPDIGSDDTLYDIYRMPHGTTLCCLKGENKVASLFETIVRGETGHSSYAWKQGDPAMSDIYGGPGAHLHMTVHGSVVSWTGNDKYNTAFCSGLTCKEGNITIPEEGTYLVYSFITIQNYQQFISNKNLLHIIWRKNSILDKLGAQRLLFVKTSPKRSGQHTSFMAAILNLRRKDTLRVELSQNYYPFLDKRPLTNYFGVIKV